MRPISRALIMAVLATAYAASCAVPTDPTVYVVEKGKSYHVKNCRLKSGSHAMKLSVAKQKGYKPCKVCNPPK